MRHLYHGLTLAERMIVNESPTFPCPICHEDVDEEHAKRAAEQVADALLKGRGRCEPCCSAESFDHQAKYRWGSFRLVR